MESILKLHIKSGEFGHGYLLCGNFDLARESAIEAAEVLLNGDLNSHPDFFHRAFDLFGVKESAELKEMASKRPFVGDRKVFIVEIFSFSSEAGNSLLKTFEEPTDGTHFFIITSSPENVLPTLRSRLTLVDFSNNHEPQSKYDYDKFLKSNSAERLNIINKMLGKDFNENKKMAIEFVNGLEVAIASQLGGPTAKYKALKEIQNCRQFLFDRAPSIKMILEHLALVLPVM